MKKFTTWLCLALILALFVPVLAPAAAASDESPFADVRKGDIVTFGRYEQDDKTRTGPEDIEWIVLTVEDDQALLLSRYVLDSKAFHHTGRNGGTAWEDSDLREWLNEEFYEDAFTDEEKEWIYLSEIPNARKQNYGLNEYDTEDHVFVLSLYEAKELLPSKKTGAAEPTKYALAQGVQKSQTSGNSWWWLRTSAKDPSRVNVVFSSGIPSREGEEMHETTEAGGVRPSMWVSIADKVPENG